MSGMTLLQGAFQRALWSMHGLACAVMMSLKQIWRDKCLTLDTKLRIYQTLVLSVLLYAADTWTLLSADVRTLDAFHQKCLRQLLGIRWYNRVRNDEVLQRTGLTSLSRLLSRRRIIQPIHFCGVISRVRSITQKTAKGGVKDKRWMAKDVKGHSG